MALIHCPECDAEVSDSALKCPKCGKQLRKPKRGFMGKIFLWLFYLFNILMIIGLVNGLNATSEVGKTAVTEAEKAGAALGAGLGISMILGIWVIGDIITGLLAIMTRPKS